VIARQSVWSDPEVKALAGQLIPAADEVGRLQSGGDAECRLFQKIAEQGHFAGRTTPSRTRQGTYATTADGTLLASWNSNDPRLVFHKLREALETWDRIKAEGVRFPREGPLNSAVLTRADRSYPKRGLVLKVNTRDLPRDPPENGQWTHAWNQDFAWFSKEEAGQFLPGEVEPDRPRDVPRIVVERLVRFHLLDNVRGQTPPFPVHAIENASLSSRVTTVNGEVVCLRLDGRTRAVQKGKWPIHGFEDMNQPSDQERGVEMKLLGSARFDQKQARFVGFELVALGTRWGGTQYNCRGDDLAPAPIGAVLSLAGESRTDRVAPEHFRGYGSVDGEWSQPSRDRFA
jgi:hypothetical protein